MTFSLPAQHVAVVLMDGSALHLPLDDLCREQIRRVCEQVELSFESQKQLQYLQQQQQQQVDTRASISSVSSTSSSSSSRRSPSAFLSSLLSPFLPTPNGSANHGAAPPTSQQLARNHRRAARSILVDTYRRCVLPALKERLPSAYLPWAINVHTSSQLDAFDRLRDDISHLLSTAGVDMSGVTVNSKVTSTPMKRNRSGSSSVMSMVTDDSDSESESRSPVTPGTSIFSQSACSTPVGSMRKPARRDSLATCSPQQYLLAIPPAHQIPLTHRNAYSAQLAKLTSIASRLSSVKKLQVRYDREEGKRKWLEGLERGRLGDKALRRARSNGELKGISQTVSGMRSRWNTLEPIKRSGLWRSTTSEDLARALAKQSRVVHPAMMDEDEVESLFGASTQHVEEVSVGLGVGLNGDIYQHGARRKSIPRLNLSLEDSVEDVVNESVIIQRATSITLRADTKSTARPHLHHGARMDGFNTLPSLQPSRSDDSLAESESWDSETSPATAPAISGLDGVIEVIAQDVKTVVQLLPAIPATWESAKSKMSLSSLLTPLPMEDKQSTKLSRSRPRQKSVEIVDWQHDSPLVRPYDEDAETYA